MHTLYDMTPNDELFCWHDLIETFGGFSNANVCLKSCTLYFVLSSSFKFTLYQAIVPLTNAELVHAVRQPNGASF